ncbi:MAG: disulfide bond formation protein B, partial [Phyllobacteriaceae bacterium]|nr:disulfide bond formation protein B [Phyllobacteriaceae bacterium]
MLTPLSARATSLLIALVALATIIGAWIFEFAGYAPCELCLQQRWAYYAGVPL